jgi:hypothetical protein
MPVAGHWESYSFVTNIAMESTIKKENQGEAKMPKPGEQGGTRQQFHHPHGRHHEDRN